jgi:hypothetical protein
MKTIVLFLLIAVLLGVGSCSKKITEPYSDTVVTPVFTPQPYMHNPGQLVTIQCATPGAEIHYTTDGNNPDKNSALYIGQIQIDSTTTIKAVAYKPKLNPSAVAAAEYIIYQDNFYDNQYITQISAQPDIIDVEGGAGFSTIKVKVVNVECFGVPGQKIEFYTDFGNITPYALTDSLGFARANLTSSGISGIARVSAVTKKYHNFYPEFVICADTAWVDVTINDIPAEQERHITNITADPLTIYADNGITWSSISITVKDGNNNPVSGQNVQFQTTLGRILFSVNTNVAGVASTFLWDEGITGMAEVTAIVRNYDTDNPDQILSQDTAFINIAILPSPTDVYSIRFIQTGQIDLNVANTGTDSFIMRVKLYNHDGNLITEHINVWFRLLNSGASGGANLNNHAPGDSVLAVSQNGIAQVTLQSGTVSGTLIVKASCTDNGRYRETVKDNIVVHSGPAHRIEIFAGGDNSGENLGGGLWRIVVGATCFDLYNNPVSYGTSVWFSIPDNPYNCQIGANGYIGNESIYGDSLAGTAYTTLIYSGIYSGLPITIRAETGGYNGAVVYGIQEIILPPNNLQLEVEIIPGNFVFHGNVNPVPASVLTTLHVYVNDIQGSPVSYAVINLTTSYGAFEYTTGTNTDPDYFNPVEMPNVIITNQGGGSLGLIRFYPDGIPLGDIMTGQPGILPVTITASLTGTDISISGQTTLIRYPI